MKAEKTRSDWPSQQAEDGFTVKEGAHPLEKCAAALAAGLVLSSCAGIPAQPPQRDCPKDALAVMERLNVPLGNVSSVHTDVNRPGGYTDVSNFREGPLVSVFVKDFFGRPGDLPPGTLLYGYLWTRGKRIIAHYDRAKLPTGDIIPVCFVFGNGERQGLPRSWDPSPPGTANLPLEIPVVAVDHFE